MCFTGCWINNTVERPDCQMTSMGHTTIVTSSYKKAFKKGRIEPPDLERGSCFLNIFSLAIASDRALRQWHYEANGRQSSELLHPFVIAA